MRDNHVYDYVVIGAGVAGTLAVEALRNQFPRAKIALVEQGKEIMPSESTTMNSCGKLHLGPHYHDLETAQALLESTMSIAADSSQLILDIDNDDAPTRHGEHYFMSNSLFPVEEALKNLDDLKAHYRKTLLTYPAAAQLRIKKVLGEPNDFYTVLEPKDYPHIAAKIPFVRSDGTTEEIFVKAAVRTNEPQIDLTALAKHFREKFAGDEKTYLRFDKPVERVQPCEKGYEIIVGGEVLCTATNKVVNCTWANIETLTPPTEEKSQTSGVVTNRVKVAIKVKLHPELINVNTGTFSTGLYMSFTNNGDGTAQLTYECVTNAGKYPAGSPLKMLSPELGDLLTHPLNPNDGKGKKIAEAILKGCAAYIPNLKKVNGVMCIQVGTVRVPGELPQNYLSDPKSQHHMREARCVEQVNSHFFNFEATKLVHAWPAAKYLVHVFRLLSVVFPSSQDEQATKDFINSGAPESKMALLRQLLVLFAASKKASHGVEQKKSQEAGETVFLLDGLATDPDSTTTTARVQNDEEQKEVEQKEVEEDTDWDGIMTPPVSPSSFFGSPANKARSAAGTTEPSSPVSSVGGFSDASLTPSNSTPYNSLPGSPAAAPSVRHHPRRSTSSGLLPLFNIGNAAVSDNEVSPPRSLLLPPANPAQPKVVIGGTLTTPTQHSQRQREAPAGKPYGSMLFAPPPKNGQPAAASFNAKGTTKGPTVNG